MGALFLPDLDELLFFAVLLAGLDFWVTVVFFAAVLLRFCWA
jgi:hypothetical protein